MGLLVPLPSLGQWSGAGFGHHATYRWMRRWQIGERMEGPATSPWSMLAHEIASYAPIPSTDRIVWLLRCPLLWTMRTGGVCILSGFKGRSHFGSSVLLALRSHQVFAGTVFPFALMAGSPSREDHAKRPRHELGMDSPFTPLLHRQHANGYAPLEDENVDRVPLCPPDHHHQSEGLVSLDGLAAVVRREIQNAIRPVEGKLTSLHTVLNTRMDSMEGVLQQHDVKIAKLEDLVRDHDGEKFRIEMQEKIDEKIVDLQKQIDKLGGGHAMPAADVAKTLVVGDVCKGWILCLWPRN